MKKYSKNLFKNLYFYVEINGNLYTITGIISARK